jgi:hypothetical protein
MREPRAALGQGLRAECRGRRAECRGQRAKRDARAHEDVHALGDALFAERVVERLVVHVARHDRHRQARLARADLRGQLVELRLAARDEDEIAVGGGERARGGLADAGATTRDQRGAAGERHLLRELEERVPLLGFHRGLCHVAESWKLRNTTRSSVFFGEQTKAVKSVS